MHPDTSQARDLSPQRFLRELGIGKRPEFEPNSPEWDAAVRRAGANPDTAPGDNGFGPAAGNIFFADARVGRATLSNDFDRYVEHLKALREFRNFPTRTPRRIAELGGGAGVVAIYLARQFPTADVVVYDWAEKPLEMGRRLAQEQNLSNIHFVQASYEDLGSVSRIVAEPSDLVLLYHGLPLNADLPIGTAMCSYKETFEGSKVSPPTDMVDAASAVSRLLDREGVGIVSGGWTPWGTVHFFEAVRQTNLGIDWSRSFVDGQIKKDEFQLKVGYAFLRPDLPRLAESAWADARGFFSSGEFKDSKLAFSVGAAEAFSGLFEGGRELLSAFVTFREHAERIRMLCKCGLLYLEHSGSPWFRRSCVQSLAALQIMVDRAAVIARKWKEISGAALRRNYDPGLLAVLGTPDPLFDAK